MGEFNIMHPILLCLQSFHFHTSPLQHGTPKELINNKQNLKSKHPTPSSLQHSFIHHSCIRSCSVSHSVAFCAISTTHKIFIAISHWSGLRFLAHHHHWNFTEIPLGYLAVAPSHVVLFSRTSPSHTP